MVLSEGEKKIGVLVDAIMGKQVVLIKSLGRLIKRAPYVMGCTILSDSRLILVLNTREIVNSPVTRPLAALLARPDHAARKAHTILLVDDWRVQRNHLGGILTQAGYQVELAENGLEGLKSLRMRRFSVLCVDIVMPLMDGFEFVERVRRLADHAGCPIFFITARTDPIDKTRAASLGVHAYFVKPVDPDLLLQALDQTCAGP